MELTFTVEDTAAKAIFFLAVHLIDQREKFTEKSRNSTGKPDDFPRHPHWYPGRHPAD
jgi:hypothetical protein